MPKSSSQGSSVQSPQIRGDGLQLDEHRPFQEKTWTAERIGWGCFAALAIAAVLGFTGAGGPFSTGRAANAAASVDYPRIARWGAPDPITVTFAPAEGAREIALSSAFAEEFELQRIVPPPSGVSVREGAHVLRYEAADAAPASMTLFVTPRAPGLARFDITVGGEAPMSLSTFILP